jgi:hypothetical protein
MRPAGIAAAQRLGLLDAMVEARSIAEVAATLDLDETGTRWLVAALAAEGILESVGDAYRTARRPASSDAPGAALLADVLRRKQPLSWHEIAGNPDAAALTTPLASTSAYDLARQLAPVLAGGGFLVDIGCGTGAIAGAILDAAPTATALLVDRPPVLAMAARELTRHRARIELRAEDVRTFTPPACRAALLSQVLHVLDRAGAADLVRRSAAALVSGGMLAIVEVAFTTMATVSAAAAWFALSLHVHGLPGLLATADIIDWLRAAGLVEIADRPVATTPASVIVTARAPATNLFSE